jgi:hypothetical protein
MTTRGKVKVLEGNNDYQDPDKTVNIMFCGLPTMRAQKLTLREIIFIEPATATPHRWWEVPITFSCID